MRHPIDKYNQIQAQRLAALPHDQREHEATLYRIGNAVYCYQYQFNDVAGITYDSEVRTTSEDLIEWLERHLGTQEQNRSAEELLRIYFDEYLEGLSNEKFREAERARGLEKAKRSWPFRRYVLERNDLGMDEFMRLNLSDNDYAFYKWSSESL